MIRHVKRSEQGYRVGEDHHNAKAPDAAVKRARDLYEFEGVRDLSEIARRVSSEFGVNVSRNTAMHWVYYFRRCVTPREREERVPTHRTLR